MLDHEFHTATARLAKLYPRQWNTAKLNELKQRVDSSRLHQNDLARAVDEALGKSNSAPVINTLLKLAKEQRMKYRKANTIKPVNEKPLCPQCCGTSLVECKTGDEETPVVLMGCPTCKAGNSWGLPMYTTDFVIIDRWAKWKPSKDLSFEALVEKWTALAKASKAYFDID